MTYESACSDLPCEDVVHAFLVIGTTRDTVERTRYAFLGVY